MGLFFLLILSCNLSVVNKVVQNHLTLHMWVLWLFSRCFLSLCSLTSSLTSSLLFVLNCWTSRCAGEPHHSHALCFISLVLPCPSSVSSPPSPPSSTLNLFAFPLPCLYICLSSLFHSSPHPSFSCLPTSPLPPLVLISVAVGSLFKCSIGEGLRFMQGQCGMW